MMTVYKIRDARGRLAAEHVREDHADGTKTVRWRQPDGSWGLNGTKLGELPLYGAELVSDLGEDELIVLVEGEKARDALEAAGLPAVASVTGAAGTPGPAALEVLRDRRVCLWPDADDKGRAHMERIATALHGVANEVLIFTWHDAPEHGDAADHPAVRSRNRRGVDRLLGELESAPRWKPSESKSNGYRAETFTASDLMAVELPPPTWIVPGVLPEGVSLLAGKPKLGKSWMALAIAVAVASGGVALGKVPVEQGDVLYLALEDNRRRLQKRLGILLHGDPAPDSLHISLDWRRLDDGGADDLDAFLSKNPDTRLVAVDTLKKVRPRVSGNRSVYEVDYEALEPLLPIAAEHEVAILVVHHTRKAGADDPLDEISGSTGLTGGVDGAMVLKRERGRADAFLHITGRDIEEDVELALRWDRETAGWIIAGDAAEYRLSEERAEVVRVLEETGEPMTPTEVADVLDKRPGSVKKLLWTMARDGQLTAASGRYSPNDGNPGNPVTEDGGNGGQGYPVTEVTGFPGGAS